MTSTRVLFPQSKGRSCLSPLVLFPRKRGLSQQLAQLLRAEQSSKFVLFLFFFLPTLFIQRVAVKPPFNHDSFQSLGGIYLAKLQAHRPEDHSEKKKKKGILVNMEVYWIHSLSFLLLWKETVRETIPEDAGASACIPSKRQHMNQQLFFKSSQQQVPQKPVLPCVTFVLII